MIFTLSAAFGAYQIAANTAFVVRVPDERRAQAFGIASMGVIVGQGAGFVAAGAAAGVVTPAVVIAAGGGAGPVVVFVLTFRWRQVSPPGGRRAAGWRPGHAGGPRPGPAARARGLVGVSSPGSGRPGAPRRPGKSGKVTL